MIYIDNNNTVFLFPTSDMLDVKQRESQLLSEYGLSPEEWQLAFDDDIRGVSDEEDLHSIYAIQRY